MDQGRYRCLDTDGLADTLKAIAGAGNDAEAVRADLTVQADVDRLAADVGELFTWFGA